MASYKRGLCPKLRKPRHWPRRDGEGERWVCEPGYKNMQHSVFSQIPHLSDPSTMEASNFQTTRKTQFIIHGFIDKRDESWVTDVCKVGAGSDPELSHWLQSLPSLSPLHFMGSQCMSLATRNPYPGSYENSFPYFWSTQQQQQLYEQVLTLPHF